MSGLLYKDLSLMKNNLKMLLIFPLTAVMLVMANNDGGSFVIFYMACVGGILAANTISYDEFEKGMEYLLTLPVDRKTYVYEKYVFGGLSGGLMWLGAVLLVAAANMIRHTGLDTTELAVECALAFTIMVAGMCVMIPLQLKFGAENTRLALVVVFLGVMAVCALAGKIGKAAGVDLQTIGDRVFLQGLAEILITLFGICVAAAAVSIAISVHVMNRKEY